MSVLHNGDRFPSLTVARVGGGQITLPDDLAGSNGVVLVYRGSWCPYCNAQLAGFARAESKLADLGIKVIALSVDDAPTSAALMEKLRLRIPVGHSINADQIAGTLGAYTNPDPKYVQGTGFILDPNGHIMLALYSSGAIGRLVAEDVAGFVKYVREHP